MPELPIPPTFLQRSRLVEKSPVFYGWIIALSGSLGMIMTSPGQTYAVSVFIEHFIRDLEISRTVVSSLYMAATLGGSLAQPWIGRQIDRRGPRLMVGVLSFLFGLACFFMGAVQNALMLGLGFLAIRMLGQGGLALVSQNVINQWWIRRRGVIMGFSGVLLSLVGLGSFPPLINWLIAQYGWRSSYMVLGGMLLLVMLPVGLLFFRNRPEQFGLQPDGVVPTGQNDEETKNATVQVNEENWTAAEAMRTAVFWIGSSGMAVIAMMITGMLFHIVSIFQDNGLPPTAAASVFLPIAVTTAVVNLSSGILVGRIPIRVMLSLALLFQSATLLLAPSVNRLEMVVAFGVLLGISSGFMATIGAVMWATYFGRRHLGTIAGTTSTILIAGSSLGPLPLGIAHDILGSYDLALRLLAILPFTLAILSFFFDKPGGRREA
jgi:MFS transporter, OFA family, oxalate/formate antiporter